MHDELLQNQIYLLGMFEEQAVVFGNQGAYSHLMTQVKLLILDPVVAY